MIPGFRWVLTLTLPPDVVTEMAGRRCPSRSGGTSNRGLPCLPQQLANPATLELGEASLQPPRSRPLATVIADRITLRDVGHGYKDHKPYGAPRQPAPLDPVRRNGPQHLLRQPPRGVCDGGARAAHDPR